MGEPWFRPKAFGFGAGLPIRWQGWALYTLYWIVLAAGLFLAGAPEHGDPVSVVLAFAVPTAILIVVAWAKTEGGWRWRS